MSIGTTFMVKAYVFLAWWKKLIELDKHFTELLTDEEWRRPGSEVRTLIIALDDVGRAAGATSIFVMDTPGESIQMGTTLNPDFDWINGEIHFGSTPHDWPGQELRGEDLITRVERVTRILADSVSHPVTSEIAPPSQIGFHYPRQPNR
jgi:hypothetical protein